MRNRARLTLVAVTAVLALWIACGGQGAPSNPAGPSSSDAPLTPAPAPTPPTVVFSGTGDIASCSPKAMSQNERVSKLLDGLEGLVYTTGDNAYEKGTPEEFQKCYDPAWGRHRARTRPSPGNHDYYTPGAAGYFAYFGENAGPPGQGYYSFDYGAWKILSLNSNVPAGPGSAQYNWTAEELRNTTAKCTLAYWHHPVFSSGYEGNMKNMRPIWELLYEHNADIVLVGHSHNYERFGPQDINGQLRPGRGIREFVVGTGGNEFTGLESMKANSEVFNNSSAGVLKLSLAPADYSWEFIPAAGFTFRDFGSDVCF